MKDYSWNELLVALDSMMGDYGNRDLEIPEELYDNWENDKLSEDEAQIIFELNDGDVNSMQEYLEESE